MEGFGAHDCASDEVCRSQVASCTIFIGILAHQYGSVHQTSGKSYSERECDFAEALGKKRLMFLAPEDFPERAHFIEPDHKREQQRAFRKRVEGDRQVAFFSNEDELGRMVLQAIHNCKTDLAREFSLAKTSRIRKTWLLLPFVTNQSGFDTGISVANASLDPLGTEPQSGPLTIWFYGQRASPLQTTPIAPGQLFTTLISICAPAFQG